MEVIKESIGKKVISQEKEKSKIIIGKKIDVDDETIIAPLSVAVNINILQKLIRNWQAKSETL